MGNTARALTRSDFAFCNFASSSSNRLVPLKGACRRDLVILYQRDISSPSHVVQGNGGNWKAVNEIDPDVRFTHTRGSLGCLGTK